MFVGLMGRGFSSKCKSLIAKLRSRIGILKRKRNAVIGYLKKDIAELLKHDLVSNAYGRVDGLIIEMNRVSCYDDIEKFSDLIMSNLASMRKKQKCPEECVSAVSSLMFAAARFADLPELRNLRQIFTEKYGNAIEPFVNKEFAEKAASEPASMDQKVKLIRMVCEEFSVALDTKTVDKMVPSVTGTPTGERGSMTVKREGDCSSGGDHKAKKIICTRRDPSHGVSAEVHGQQSPSLRTEASNDEGQLLESRLGHASTRKLDSEQERLLERRLEHASPRKLVSEQESGNAMSQDAPTHFIPPPYVRLGKRASELVLCSPQVDGVGNQDRNCLKDRGQVGADGTENEMASGSTNGDTDAGPRPRSMRTKGGKPPQNKHHARNDSATDDVDIRDGDWIKGEDEARRNGGTSVKHLGEGKKEAVQAPARLTSLQAQQAEEMATPLARAASFQANGMKPYVHPKLPDYEDLASRLAALRAGK